MIAERREASRILQAAGSTPAYSQLRHCVSKSRDEIDPTDADRRQSPDMRRVVVRFRAGPRWDGGPPQAQFIANGVFVLDDIREWTIFVDAFRGSPATGPRVHC